MTKRVFEFFVDLVIFVARALHSENFLRTSELQETLGLVRAASPRADCEGISQD